MILTMEEKQLDFNQPLLSVRRFKSPVASESENKAETNNSRPRLPPIPVYKSDLKSGPMRNPGTVPFLWERTPGRPKDESKLQAKVHERQSCVPKLPPGRVVKIKQGNSERTPRATQSTKENVFGSEHVKTVSECPSKDESLKLVKKEKLSSGSDDENEAYIDALDTLSRTESFVMSCSVSGVGELEELDTKPSGTFSTDLQIRDFMMGRFLPAAKAVAAETPPHATRKALVVQEQPRQLWKPVNIVKQQTPDRKRATALPHYLQDTGVDDTDDDDEDGYDETGNYASKICGLFPTFCLLNPIPGMGMQERMPLSSFQGLQAKANVASHRETRKGRARNVSFEEKSITGSLKIACNKNESKVENEFEQANCERDGSSGYKLQGSGVSASQKANLYREEPSRGPPGKCKDSKVKVMNPHGKQSHAFGELLAKECTALESDSHSPAEKTLHVDAVHRFKSISSPNAIEMEDRILEKGSSFQPSIKGNKNEGDPAPLESSLEDDDRKPAQMDEKATLHSTSSQAFNSCFLNCRDRTNLKVIDDSRCDGNLLQDLTTLRISERVENGTENHGPTKPDLHGNCHASVHDSRSFLNPKVADSLVADVKRQRAKKTDSSEVSIHDSVSKQSSNCPSVQKFSEKKSETRLGEKKCSRQSAEGYTALALSKLPCECDGKIRLEGKLDHGERDNAKHLQLPLSLPLPQAPSESWLKRALPAVSSRNISSRPPLALQVSSRIHTKGVCDPNWESMVKSSNTHYSHVGLSEEKLAPIPES